LVLYFVRLWWCFFLWC